MLNGYTCKRLFRLFPDRNGLNVKNELHGDISAADGKGEGRERISCHHAMKNIAKAKKAVSWILVLLTLALVLLSVFRPEIVGTLLGVLGKGGGKLRLTGAAECFRPSIESVIYGLVLPKGEDPNIMTVVKTLVVEVVGLSLMVYLGTVFSENLDTGLGTGVLYAYFPCTAAVFLINGIGISNLYLTVSVIILALVGLFARK